MRVAVDNGPTKSGHSVRGVGWYTKELIENLKSVNTPQLETEDVDFREADLSKYDLLHYPYFSLFQHTLPLFPKSKFVVTIHDLIPLIYPEHYPAGIRGSINFLLQRMAVKKASAIITDSETSKKDIVRFLGIDPNIIHVVYLAPRKIFKKVTDMKLLNEVGKKYDLPHKFVLYVGDINYNKNIVGLVKACKLAEMPLVISGKQAAEVEKLDLAHPELRHLKEVINDLKDVKRLGFVPEEDLVCIYNLATVYCQPSFYEGFGLPPLEAYMSGTSVAASKTQALVEILGEGARYFDPKDYEDMARSLGENGKRGSLPREYSWEKTAGETAEVYKLMK